MSINGTQTEKNLLKAFAGESQARNRYTYYASKAIKDGFENIAKIFEETANQEKEHAKRFFSFLDGGNLEIQAAFPAGRIGTTLENLQASAAGEHEEYTALYPAFAQTAREEGFTTIAKLFEYISVAEQYHGKRFSSLASSIENNSVFKSAETVTWRCLNCGYIHTGTEAPQSCPACTHPQAYFEKL